MKSKSIRCLSKDCLESKSRDNMDKSLKIAHSYMEAITKGIVAESQNNKIDAKVSKTENLFRILWGKHL